MTDRNGQGAHSGRKRVYPTTSRDLQFADSSRPVLGGHVDTADYGSRERRSGTSPLTAWGTGWRARTDFEQPWSVRRSSLLHVSLVPRKGMGMVNIFHGIAGCSCNCQCRYNKFKQK